MPTSTNTKQAALLSPRRLPTQQRAIARRRQIFDTTARLLEQVGIDDLTTILIAKEMGISVGALYHYFPNKHAILHGLGAEWLDEMTTALNELESQHIESMSLDQFVESAVDRLLSVYINQRAILPLMHIIDSIPELRQLDEAHDEMLIGRFIALFQRLGFNVVELEMRRIATLYLETTHSLFLIVVEQPDEQGQATIADIKRMCIELLRTAKTV